ncbi:hypothetical protein FRB99_000692 [Tulasnella sp. 403]|nr:hypothetical protein FRB99_000692 [Tulasnella sp. 403]
MASQAFLTPPRVPHQPPAFQLANNHKSLDKLSPSTQSSPFMPSSPLNPYSSAKNRGSLSASGTPQLDGSISSSRRTSYKARRPVASGTSATPEAPFASFLRDKMKAKCVERIAKDRSKARKKFQMNSSSEAGGSSDAEMEEDEDEEMADDDPMLLRFMAAEMRRQRHREQYLFECQVGSSFDPDMEEFYTSENPGGGENGTDPKDEFDFESDDDEALAAEYEEYLQAQAAQQSPPSSQPNILGMTLSSDAAGPSSHTIPSSRPLSDSVNHFLNHVLHSSCPQCHATPLQISSDVQNAVLCTNCLTTYPLNDAASSWVEDHLSPDSYVPLHHA